MRSLKICKTAAPKRSPPWSNRHWTKEWMPRDIPAAARAVGNAALSGAALLLLDPAARAVAEHIAEAAVTVDLSAHPAFSEHYIRGMSFEPIE